MWKSSINQIEPMEFGPLLGVNHGTSLGAGSPNPTNTSFDYLLDECFPLFSISGLGDTEDAFQVWQSQYDQVSISAKLAKE
jgi:hypothetical protein